MNPAPAAESAPASNTTTRHTSNVIPFRARPLSDREHSALGTAADYLSNVPDDTFKDAEIYGEWTPEVADLPIAISVAKERYAKEWDQQKEARFADVFKGIFSTHKPGKKEGQCFVTGTLGKSKRRTKNNVLANYMLGIDVDSGASLQECFERVRASGLTAIFYTTHSHETTRVEIAYDRFHRWSAKAGLPTEPTDESIQRYMREETSYVKDVCDSAIYIAKEQDDGMKIIVQTRPIDKFRLIFPLATPFIYKDQPGAHKDVINLWEQKVLGLGLSFGVEPDRAARDPSRLFYLPRHAKGAENSGSCSPSGG